MARFQMLPNMGKHYTRKDGKKVCVKPGDVIEVDEHELGGALNKFKRLDPPDPEPQPTQALYAEHAGAGRWNVINRATGEPINDELLTRAQAESLVEEGLVEQNEEDEEDEEDAGPDDGQTADTD